MEGFHDDVDEICVEHQHEGSMSNRYGNLGLLGMPMEGGMITQEMTNGHLAAESQEAVEPQELPVGELQEDRGMECDSVAAEERSPIESIDQMEVKGMLEALLFVAHEPLTLEKMAGALEHVPKSTIQSVLEVLQSEYEQNGRGLQIAEVAGGYQCVTRPEYGRVIKRLIKGKTTAKLSRSALETLAIIGYKQPMTRADIEKIRGVETSGVLRTLLDQKLVRIVGRQDVPGRPILYGTSKQFLHRFGLRDLRDLPPLKEIKELGDPEQDLLDASMDADSSSEESSLKDMSA